MVNADPVVLAKMALGRMRPKHGALVEALNGRFDDHHAELARMLLDQIDSLSAKVESLTTRIGAMIDIIGAAAAPVCDDAARTALRETPKPLSLSKDRSWS